MFEDDEVVVRSFGGVGERSGCCRGVGAVEVFVEHRDDLELESNVEVGGGFARRLNLEGGIIMRRSSEERDG